MKKYLLATALAGMSSLALATTCQYPLDAPDSLYSQAGINRFPYLPAPYQSVGYTVLNTTGQGNTIYYGMSNNGSQAIIDAAGTGLPGGDAPLPTSGIVAMEIALDRFPTVSSSEAYQDLSVGFNTSNGMTGVPYPVLGNAFAFGMIFQNTTYDGGPKILPFAVRRSDGLGSTTTGTAVPLPQPVPAGYRSGLYFNMNTRQVGYTVNGVDYGYLKNADGTPFTIPTGVQAGLLLATANVAVFSDTDPTIGMDVGGTLITDAAQFTQPFPAGFTDICGNAGPTVHGLRLPNGKPYPGKANPPGLQKFQSLPLGSAPLGVLLKAAK